MAVDYAIGLCDGCGRPVVKPECVVKGAARCVCPQPQLVTWADMDAEYQRAMAERERRFHESPYQPRDSFGMWKKRAKRL